MSAILCWSHGLTVLWCGRELHRAWAQAAGVTVEHPRGWNTVWEGGTHQCPLQWGPSSWVTCWNCTHDLKSEKDIVGLPIRLLLTIFSHRLRKYVGVLFHFRFLRCHSFSVVEFRDRLFLISLSKASVFPNSNLIPFFNSLYFILDRFLTSRVYLKWL